MLKVTLALLLIAANAVVARPAVAGTVPSNAVVFANLDDSAARDNGATGWGWCSSCAGGANSSSDLWMAQNQTQYSIDGTSTEFHVGGAAFTNALFYDKLGPNSSLSNFQFDFYFTVDASSAGAQAYEFDVFQFVSGVRYMFGSQCNYSQGVWNVWGEGNTHWFRIPVSCPRFTPGVTYHITWMMHRTADQKVHYDSLTINGTTYSLNIARNAGPAPAGWGDNLGVQFQLDIAGAPASLNQWVDEVSLTAW